MKPAELHEKEEKVLAELDELKHTGGWHKIRIEVLKSYAREVAEEAYHAGFVNKTPDTNFKGYWKLVTDKTE